MELCTVAPCFDCGNLEQELADLAAGRHEYRWYEIFGQRIILCDFCDVDFGSYYPDFFGLPGARPGAANYQLRFIKQVWNPQSETDTSARRAAVGWHSSSSWRRHDRQTHSDASGT